jgi:A/G-specific adenine glycosylase
MDKVHLLPQKGRSIATTYLQRFVAVVQCEGHFLLRREGRRKVMADLYEFPYVETEIFHDLDTYLHALLSQQMRFECHLDEVEHSFTRYRVKLFPSLWSVQQKVAVAGYEWIEDLDKISCSSGHRKIIDNFLLDFEKR